MSGRVLNGIVFDLDGTLIESRPAIAKSVNHALRELGQDELAEADVAAHIGWGLDHLLQALVPAELVAAARPYYREHYARTAVVHTPLLPGVRDTLTALRARGFRLGVATNKPHAFARPLLDGLGIGEHFAAVSGGEAGRPLKPHPDMLERVLRELAVAPVDALYVGDMTVDGETARRAGVRFAAVATGVESDEALRAAGAEHVFPGMAELLRYVLDGSSRPC